MDTERIVVLKKTENVTMHKLDEAFVCVVCDYVEINRHIQEINQLFDVFEFNIERLAKNYKLRADDRIKRRMSFKINTSDFIAINAFVMNIISAGRSLVDSLDICMETAYGKGSERYGGYKNRISEIYEEKFAYRFFYHLRNFSQHNHLLVSTEGNFCYFDASQILTTPHYKANKKMWSELESICNEIRERYHDNFRISLSLCLAEYIAGVAQVHKIFWEEIKERLFALKSQVDSMIEREPEILEHNNEKFNGYILYQKPGEEGWHAFSPYSDTDSYYENTLRGAISFFEERDKAYSAIQKHFESISSEK